MSMTMSRGSSGASSSHKRSPLEVAGRLVAVLGLAAAVLPLSTFAANEAGAAVLSSSAHSHGTAQPHNGTRPEAVIGNVTALGSPTTAFTGTFTLAVKSKGASTTLTVGVLSTTKYREAGVKGASLADILVGDKVRVTGEASSGTITASKVFVFMAKEIGKVTSVATGGFAMTTRHGANITVGVSTLTTYREPGVKGATFSDISAGTKVHVIGAKATPGTVNAILVFIVPDRAPATTTSTTASTTTTTTS